ncbi:MAG TPA: septum formation protein Maf [Elusimicrobia bacterium]|nr:MAG: septum formation protein Maf [Elusimicrobia bacterium RIFOXYA12_FULL_49_49]OGS16176.1 MAG: septum formation protein Maf [Elusimicrobia bacterium RIFOXYA2_FULL_47_53]OGS26625.1 MAG: septum formation protein Maf [Elusimicrobia bacterium RIFOXYB12_FULL_50_12]OGS31330.1 MAG: septum formation protein Maf [Elusimicrobia bacterium RIFOXYB2_FULL_46_23]HBU69569.1 septum formation protein Maf [Elusimicrobiota bacterium]
MRAIILASGSPRRIELLKKCGLKFKIIPSGACEETLKRMPSAIVRELALRKADFVAKNNPQAVVIGADTIVVLKGEIIGKPKHAKDAARILANLNGSYHRVYSGVALVCAGKKTVEYAVSRVKMRRLSAGEIADFSHKHLDKAGAYAVQEKGDAFVEKIEGDYFNVVGLPMKLLKRMLKKYSVNLDIRRLSQSPADAPLS